MEELKTLEVIALESEINWQKETYKKPSVRKIAWILGVEHALALVKLAQEEKTNALTARIAELEMQYKDQCDTTNDLAGEITKLHSKIARLVEVGDELSEPEEKDEKLFCRECGEWAYRWETKALIHHTPDCVVTLWNKEAHE